MLLKQFPWCAEWKDALRDLFEGYVEAKQRQQVLDYDDLLLYWGELMKVPELASEVRQHFDHVLVDEYQDTNALQASILLGLKPDGAGLTVVGDDAQAIYGFRAANVRNILDFPNHFTPAARVVTLEENYRSTQPILAASNAVIGLARERFTKNLRSRRVADAKPSLVTVADDLGQVNFIVETVLRNREEGTALKEQAVLFRTSHHSAMLEIELARRNIPFIKFGGLKFVEAAHVKDVLAVLRWAENPTDRVTGFRVVQMLEGIGPTTAGKVLDSMAGRQATDALATFRPPAKAASAWRDLVELMTKLRDATAEWPAQFDLVRQWYQPHLEQKYPDAVVRAGDLDQLQRIAAGTPSRTRFLTDLTLDPPSATSDEAGAPLLDEDYLILSTIHSAKGQEWKSVFVLNVVDGCIPSDMSTGNADDIEEERRLLYVAMTRAKDQLALIVPHRFYVHNQARGGDKHLYASRSRFIPSAIVSQFEVCSWPAAGHTFIRWTNIFRRHGRLGCSYAGSVAGDRHLSPNWVACTRKRWSPHLAHVRTHHPTQRRTPRPCDGRRLRRQPRQRSARLGALQRSAKPGFLDYPQASQNGREPARPHDMGLDPLLVEGRHRWAQADQCQG